MMSRLGGKTAGGIKLRFFNNHIKLRQNDKKR